MGSLLFQVDFFLSRIHTVNIEVIVCGHDDHQPWTNRSMLQVLDIVWHLNNLALN